MKTIAQQVRELGQRVDAHMPVARFIARTQIEQLAKAEQLRKLAEDVIDSRFSFAGRACVSEVALDKLVRLLNELRPFHKAVRIPAAVRRLIAGRQKGGG